MLFLGVSQLRQMDLIFIDAMKINCAYNHEICGEFFYLPARQRSCLASAWDNQPYGTRVLSVYFTRPFSLDSLDLNPFDYEIFVEMQQRDYQTKVHDVDELKQ